MEDWWLGPVVVSGGARPMQRPPLPHQEMGLRQLPCRRRLTSSSKTPCGSVHICLSRYNVSQLLRTFASWLRCTKPVVVVRIRILAPRIKKQFRHLIRHPRQPAT